VPFQHPAWAERITTNAPWLRPVPPGDINQFAMLGINPPTAYLLLTDVVKLPRGSRVTHRHRLQDVAAALTSRGVVIDWSCSCHQRAAWDCVH